jgi:hypothetical protein
LGGERGVENVDSGHLVILLSYLLRRRALRLYLTLLSFLTFKRGRSWCIEKKFLSPRFINRIQIVSNRSRSI